MLRYISYHLIWSFINYIIRNPYARKVVGLGCLALLVLWLGSALLSAVLGAIALAVAGFSAWMTTIPDSAIVLLGIGLAVVAGAIAFVIISRSALLEWLSDALRNAKARMGYADGATPESLGPGMTPILPSADDLDSIRFLDEMESSDAVFEGLGASIEGDDDVPDQIVIYGKE